MAKFTKSQICPSCGNRHTGNSDISQEKADSGLEAQLASCARAAADAKRAAEQAAIEDD